MTFGHNAISFNDFGPQKAQLKPLIRDLIIVHR